MQTFDDAQCILSTVSVVPIKNPNELKAATAFDDDLEINDAEEDEDIYGQEITEERVVFRHMLYTAWPDHGVPEPEDRASLLNFIKLVDDTNRDTSLYPHSVAEQLHPDPPIMVGCSAGIGRTGSFIALSSLLRSLQFLPPPEDPTPTSVLAPSPLGPMPKEVQDDHIAAEVDELREQRPGMVQREEQILLIYEVLLSAFTND
ncbi:protein-tyrosine phosphatase-like protein [Cyathus striatus]|nr:protein-tyrosine phosphatase-like protein [Cyathus striatus]